LDPTSRGTKYDSIRDAEGEDKLLDVLTNVRFAKHELKEAGCYKKGLTDGSGKQGGLGGIGVENWILKIMATPWPLSAILIKLPMRTEINFL